MSKDNGSELYISQKNEHVKQYIELDAQSRPFKVYTASLRLPVGGPCEVTAYAYENVNSTTIIARKESTSVWQQAYEDITGPL